MHLNCTTQATIWKVRHSTLQLEQFSKAISVTYSSSVIAATKRRIPFHLQTVLLSHISSHVEKTAFLRILFRHTAKLSSVDCHNKNPTQQLIGLKQSLKNIPEQSTKRQTWSTSSISSFAFLITLPKLHNWETRKNLSIRATQMS